MQKTHGRIILALIAGCGAWSVGGVAQAQMPSCLSLQETADSFRVIQATSTVPTHPERIKMKSAMLERRQEEWRATIVTELPYLKNGAERGNIVVLFDQDGRADNNDATASDVRGGADVYYSLPLRAADATSTHVTKNVFSSKDHDWVRTQTSSTGFVRDTTIELRIPIAELPEKIDRWRVFGALGAAEWTAMSRLPIATTTGEGCDRIFLPPQAISAQTITTKEAVKNNARNTQETAHRLPLPIGGGILVAMALAAGYSATRKTHV